MPWSLPVVFQLKVLVALKSWTMVHVPFLPTQNRYWGVPGQVELPVRMTVAPGAWGEVLSVARWAALQPTSE